MTKTTYIRSRPIGVFWACVLIAASAAYSFAINLIELGASGVSAEIGNIALSAFFVWGLFQRKNWVRLVFLAFAILVPCALLLLYSAPAFELLANAAVVLSLICVILLVIPSSSRWFYPPKRKP